MRYERSGSTVCPLNTPSKRPSSCCGNHDGQYTGALILFASCCQPAFHSFGQVGGAESTAEAVVLEVPPPHPATSSEHAYSSAQAPDEQHLSHVRSPSPAVAPRGRRRRAARYQDDKRELLPLRSAGLDAGGGGRTRNGWSRPLNPSRPSRRVLQVRGLLLHLGGKRHDDHSVVVHRFRHQRQRSTSLRSRTRVSPTSGTRSVTAYSQAPDGKRMVIDSEATGLLPPLDLARCQVGTARGRAVGSDSRVADFVLFETLCSWADGSGGHE